jgi:signal transduction histidine kinase
LLALTVVSITLALAAALGDVVRAYVRRTQRERQLLFLGRFSAQMAHDLKNPLAALKGALDYMAEEKRRGRLADDDDFLDLAKSQVGRIEAVITDYQRFGEQPTTSAGIELGEVVERAAERASSGGVQNIELDVDIEPGLPRCPIDDGLFGRVLDNVLQNALEAMPDGGSLSVSVRPSRLDESTPAVAVSCSDSGEGMDARQQAVAFEEFQSNKGSSGLGLAFVRRAIEAHRGEVRLRSTLGQGTTVELRLPAAKEESG